MTRIVIVGGASPQWTPMLAADIARTPALHGSELVLHDVDTQRLPGLARYCERVSDTLGARLAVRADEELATAARDADFVIVSISTGGLDTMEVDLSFAARHGFTMPVGDTIGPAGIARSLRNVPVMAGIARAVESVAPDAWFVNITNPLTTLTRTATATTGLRVVGLCHELLGASFFLSQLLGVDFFGMTIRVTGVNHLPLIVAADVDGVDRLPDAVALARGDGDLDEPLPMLDVAFSGDHGPSAGVGGPPEATSGWTKRKLLERWGANFAVLRDFGALPGADPNHVTEFFPGFLTHASDGGARWGAHPVTIADRRARETQRRAAVQRAVDGDVEPMARSTEQVIPVVAALATGTPAHLPVDIPQAGQCPDLPAGAVVECIGVIDGAGIHGRDVATAPPVLAQLLQRIALSQELTVRAALDGDGDALLGALFSDPLCGRSDHGRLVTMRDELLPQLRTPSLA